jgi:hypothetical protein
MKSSKSKKKIVKKNVEDDSDLDSYDNSETGAIGLKTENDFLRFYVQSVFNK